MPRVSLLLNPFGAFRRECEEELKEASGKVLGESALPSFALVIPASPGYGELSSSLCFDYASKVKVNAKELAEKLVAEIPLSRRCLIDKVEAVNGYVNFHVNFPLLCSVTFEAVRTCGRDYGRIKTSSPLRIIVEHTSANPSGSLHVGTARNAILGDALARLLAARGHEVKRHFYVDDVGKQVATLAYGYRLAGMPRLRGKPDEWLGRLYTLSNALVSIETLKRKITQAKDAEVAVGLSRQLDEYAGIIAELGEKPDFDLAKIQENIQADPEPEASIERIIHHYEMEDRKVARLIRRLVKQCLRGQRSTLREAGITFDSWDWESDLVWQKTVKEAVEKLVKQPFTKMQDDALTLDVNLAAEAMGLKESLGFDATYEIPPLVLMRRDGTSLYTTRDIAYHIKKFKAADRCINIIGVDQKLAQLQLKIALVALGISQAKENLIHIAYELVNLPGYKMSRRLGRYVTFDDILRQAISMAYSEVEKRSPQLPEALKRRISRAVGIGAVKYALLSVSALKKVVFTWDRVINFEMNSAPFIQYAYARCYSILQRLEAKPSMPDYALLTHPLERRVVVSLARYPEVFLSAADELRPELLLQYANAHADAFNAFYNELRVLQADPESLRNARLRIVQASKIVLRSSLTLAGITAPPKM